MTVSSQTSNETFDGNGVTTIWDLPFRFFDNSDIFVYLIDPIAQTSTPMSIGTDYTLTGAGLPEQFGTAPGKITTVVPVANLKQLYVERVMQVEQLTDIVNQGRFFPEVHEDVFDRLTMLIQQTFSWFGRALVRPVGKDYYDAEGRLIKNLGDGVADQDAVNVRTMRGYVDSAIAGVIGGFGFFLQAGIGAVSRTFQSKMRDDISVKDFGSAGDNLQNEVPSWTLAKNNAKAVFVPSGTYKFDSAYDSGNTPLIGLGVATNPALPSGPLLRSFIDLGKKAIYRQTVRAAGEFSGTPTNYTYLRDLTSFDILHNNAAGYQQNLTSDAGGRTSVPCIFIEGTHSGYGDMPGTSVHYSISHHPGFASTTFWTGNNSIVSHDADMHALTDNVNLYGTEMNVTDNGFDSVTAHGAVLNMFRTNGAVPTKGNVWTGVRLQSLGSQFADSGLSINGQWKVGIDFSGATLANNCAVALKSNDRIYFGTAAKTLATGGYANVLPTNYINFDSAKYNIVANNVAALQISGTTVLSTVLCTMNLSFNVPSAGNIINTVGAAGGASALPATPFTYLKIQLDGATYKIPVYNN